MKLFGLEWEYGRAGISSSLAKGIKLALSGRVGAALLGNAVGEAWDIGGASDAESGHEGTLGDSAAGDYV
ncbi:hypothetical protein [Nocardia sp. NPDC004260]